jgi:stearoyl-CoA desaturase (delta-9 desaturase)
VDFGNGWRGALRGLYHAHMGWLFTDHGRAARRRYAPDLVEDPRMRAINRRFHWVVGLSLLAPFLIGFALDRTLAGALTALLWGGLVRIFFQHHVTWSINSVCHFFGRRRFDVDDHSTNVLWLALPSLGESWHHNHHAFPRSAQHGLRWWEVDPSALVIGALQRVGLAWNVVRIPSERQSQRLARAEEQATAA